MAAGDPAWLLGGSRNGGGIMTLDRTSYLGGTDVAAVCGRSEYKSRMDVYLLKTGQMQPHPANEAMLWGQLIEPLILDWWETQTGGHTERQVFARDKNEPWLAGTADAIGVLPDGRRVLLEAKKIAASSRSQWQREIPIDYRYQVQHYLLVHNMHHAEICVLFGGSEFAMFHVERDADVIAEIRREARRMWLDHIEQRIPPSPLEHELASAVEQVAIDDNADAVRALQHLVQLRQLAKTLDEQILEQQELLESLTKGVASLTFRGTEVASWKTVTRQPSTTAGKTWRQFNFKPQASLVKLLADTF